MALLVKALSDAGLAIPIYAYYPALTGTPTALSQIKGATVYQFAIAHSNHTGEYGAIRSEFKKKVNEDVYVPLADEIDLLERAGFGVDVPWRSPFAVIVASRQA
jgi:hypothetical protein